MLKIAIRADASLEIGTGHIMRCLTFAKRLVALGANVCFISRNHSGHLIDYTRSQGFPTHALTEDSPLAGVSINGNCASRLAHHQWLGVSQAEDAAGCYPILTAFKPDLLVVDHYALDSRWERALQPLYGKLMVIDDLADRRHDADVLLNQNFGAKLSAYQSLVPTHCILLCGAKFALLRPEFAALRQYSMARRRKPAFRDLLIALGGVDRDNITAQILAILPNCRLPQQCRITVVLGATAPWLPNVRELCQRLPLQTRVLVGVSNMAEIMADCDVAIGAAGATSWERCCLGVPSLIAVLAENQLAAAHFLVKANAAKAIPLQPDLETAIVREIHNLLSSQDTLTRLSRSASALTDGLGCERVIARLKHLYSPGLITCL